MPRMTSVIDDIPAGLREFTAYAMQVLAILFVVTRHVVYLTSDAPALHSMPALAGGSYGVGGPSGLVIVLIAAILLARRTRAERSTAVIAVFAFGVAAVEQFIALFPGNGPGIEASGRTVDQLITLSFTLLALVVAAVLLRAAPGAVVRPVYALPADRGPFAADDDV